MTFKIKPLQPDNDAASVPRSETIPLYFLTATAAIAIPASFYIHRALAPLFVICAVLSLIHWYANRRCYRMHTTLALGIAFAALAVESAFWTIGLTDTLKTALALALAVCGAFLTVSFANAISSRSKAIFVAGFVWGGLISISCFVVLVGWHELRHAIAALGEPQGANTVAYWNPLKVGLTVTSLLLWPWSLLAYQTLDKRYVLPIVGLAAAVILFAGADSPKIALVVGTTVAILSYVLRRKMVHGLAAFTVIVLAAIPIMIGTLTDPRSPDAKYEYLSSSAIHRIFIWQTAANNIFERPILGHGFDASRNLDDAKTSSRIEFLPTTSRTWYILSEAIPLHPHNLFLQVWLELGAVGALILGAFLVSAIYSIARKFSRPIEQAMTLGVFTHILVVALISYGAWQSWWIAAEILTITFCVAARTPAPAPSSDE